MKKLLFVTMLLFSCVGCKTDETTGCNIERSTNETYAVVVGVENSKLAGSCPGAVYDATRMYNLLSNYTTNIVLLLNEQATISEVKHNITKGISKGELFIFYYSGHGGSQHFSDTGPEEDDGRDEFYCLYDTFMRDNEMWSMISKSKNRVLLINDCCHSETIYRSPGITLLSAMSLSARSEQDVDLSMICWSGCPDDTYSYGSSMGGKFTNTLLKLFNPNASYEYMWNVISTDKTLLRYETPQETIIGDGFIGKQIFR